MVGTFLRVMLFLTASWFQITKREMVNIEIAFSQLLALARFQMFVLRCLAILRVLRGCTNIYVCMHVRGQLIQLRLRSASK
jgi:hypothetical protein